MIAEAKYQQKNPLRKNDLTKVHEGKKPFKCVTCVSKGLLKSNLSKHCKFFYLQVLTQVSRGGDAR